MAYTSNTSLLLQKLYFLPQRLVPGRGKHSNFSAKNIESSPTISIRDQGAPCTVKLKKKHISFAYPVSSYQEQLKPRVSQNVWITAQLLVCIFSWILLGNNYSQFHFIFMLKYMEPGIVKSVDSIWSNGRKTNVLHVKLMSMLFLQLFLRKGNIKTLFWQTKKIMSLL